MRNPIDVVREVASPSLEELELRSVQTEDATPTYRVGGSGPALLLIHGWPLSSLTWVPMAPALMRNFTCYFVDLAGLGGTTWTRQTDFGFHAHARRLLQVLDHAGVGPCHVLAQDSGATIARLLAAQAPLRVRSLVLLNTEIPGHRPPWIWLYRWLMFLPGTNTIFSLLLRSKTFQESTLGFGGCFADLALIHQDFERRIIRPMLKSRRAMDGLNRYLRRLDFQVVDALEQRTHPLIKAPTLLVWGEDDPTFPIAHARKMAAQFPDCRGVIAIPNARLLVHEEHPARVTDETIRFIRSLEKT